MPAVINASTAVRPIVRHRIALHGPSTKPIGVSGHAGARGRVRRCTRWRQMTTARRDMAWSCGNTDQPRWASRRSQSWWRESGKPRYLRVRQFSQEQTHRWDHAAKLGSHNWRTHDNPPNYEAPWGYCARRLAIRQISEVSEFDRSLSLGRRQFRKYAHICL